MSDKVKIGLIGSGRIGQVHAASIAALRAIVRTHPTLAAVQFQLQLHTMLRQFAMLHYCMYHIYPLLLLWKLCVHQHTASFVLDRLLRPCKQYSQLCRNLSLLQ